MTLYLFNPFMDNTNPAIIAGIPKRNPIISKGEYISRILLNSSRGTSGFIAAFTFATEVMPKIMNPMPIAREIRPITVIVFFLEFEEIL